MDDVEVKCHPLRELCDLQLSRGGRHYMFLQHACHRRKLREQRVVRIAACRRLPAIQ